MLRHAYMAVVLVTHGLFALAFPRNYCNLSDRNHIIGIRLFALVSFVTPG